MRTVVDITPQRPVLVKKKRVAAYARVSCGKDTMLHSLKAQIDYYRDFICGNPDWEFAGVYADEAKTGTKDTREQFQMLLSDCEAGLVDMVITKAISRFARNTVTLLETVRHLRELGIDVFFEEQNMHTLGEEGELLITLLASVAQEESLSCSENVKWRIRKGFEEGRASTCTMLGYRLVDGEITLIPEEAKIARRIFDLYLDGFGLQKIANTLNDEGYRTIRGNEWRINGVRKVLFNEKYVGDLCLQKFFRKDHISKVTVPNVGQLPKYLITDDHEAIVDRDTFSSVKSEAEKRSLLCSHRQGTPGVFSGKIRCAGCGKNYRRKTTRYNIMWCCATFNTKGKKYCDSKMIPESTLMSVSACALGLTEFDEDVFAARVDHVDAHDNNLLRFFFKDGTEHDFHWQDRSRSESWTAEMRAEASRKTKERKAKNG